MYVLRVLTPVLQETQRLTAFVILLLVMIDHHMLTFRLMAIMVADFGSLIILIQDISQKCTVIHSILLRDITISSTSTRFNYIPIPQYVMIHFHMQRFYGY